MKRIEGDEDLYSAYQDDDEKFISNASNPEPEPAIDRTTLWVMIVIGFILVVVYTVANLCKEEVWCF